MQERHMKWRDAASCSAGVRSGVKGMPLVEGRAEATDRPTCSFPSVFFPHYVMQIKPGLLILILRVLKSLAAADVLRML